MQAKIAIRSWKHCDSNTNRIPFDCLWDDWIWLETNERKRSRGCAVELYVESIEHPLSSSVSHSSIFPPLDTTAGWLWHCVSAFVCICSCTTKMFQHIPDKQHIRRYMLQPWNEGKGHTFDVGEGNGDERTDYEHAHTPANMHACMYSDSLCACGKCRLGMVCAHNVHTRIVRCGICTGAATHERISKSNLCVHSCLKSRAAFVAQTRRTYADTAIHRALEQIASSCHINTKHRACVFVCECVHIALTLFQILGCAPRVSAGARDVCTLCSATAPFECYTVESAQNLHRRVYTHTLTSTQTCSHAHPAKYGVLGLQFSLWRIYSYTFDATARQTYYSIWPIRWWCCRQTQSVHFGGAMRGLKICVRLNGVQWDKQTHTLLHISI